MLRGSGGPRVGETGGNGWETGVLWLQVEKTGGNLYLDMESATVSEVSGVRGGTATGAPSKIQKWAKLVSVCALTQQDWKAKKTKGEWWRL